MEDNKDLYFGEDPEEVMDSLKITLNLENGKEQECEVMGVFAVEDQDYIALYSTTPDTEGEVYLFRYSRGDDDSVELINIEGEEEYQKAVSAFNDMVEE